MGLDSMRRTGVQIMKGLNFSIKTCYRLVRDHPSILGIMLIFYLLYRFLPSVLIFCLHSSPVFICTFVLIATLVSLGNRNPPKAEEKLQRRYSRKTRIKKDDCVIEEKEITSVRTLGRKMIDIKEDVEIANANKGKARGRRVSFSPIHDYGFISRAIKMDDQPNEIFTRDEKPFIQDVSVASDDQDIQKDEIFKPVDEMSDSCSRECLKENGENVESVLDNAESSSSAMETTDAVIDEVHTVSDSQPPEPVLMSINKFDGAPEESNDCSEESEVEPEKNASKAAVSWTDDAEKKLMDLGCSEVERNKRLESLMERRRARKTMRKNTLVNFNHNDAPYQIAPLSILKNKFFDQSYYIESENGGMQPVPGSAPSILIPRKNPFDLPYDLHEEKPNLTGDSFSQEFMTVLQKDVYCRHESFCFGSTSLIPGGGGLKQDKGDTRISAFFIPEDISASSGRRHLSESSDSVSSSVLETELQSSVADQDEEQKQVIEQEGELISSIGYSPHYVEEAIQPPEVVPVENDHLPVQTRDADIPTNVGEAYINPDVVEDKLSGLNCSSCSSSSSASSEMSERLLHENSSCVVGSQNNEPAIEGLLMVGNDTNLKQDVAAVAVDYSIPSAFEKREIEESLFCVDKGMVHTSFSLKSFPSIASDMQVEVSEVGSPPMSAERTISLTVGECFQYNDSVRSDISSGSEGNWAGSSGRCAVDEAESKSSGVNEISEPNVLLGADDELNEPVVIEPMFEQVGIDTNSTSFPMKYPTEGQMSQIPASSAELEKVDPMASSSSPAQILVERSNVELPTSNGLQDSASFQMMEPTEERPMDQVPASIAERDISFGVGQLDLKEKLDPITSGSSPIQLPPSDGHQLSTSSQTREEAAVNEIPCLGAEPKMNDGSLHFENSMVQPPSNDAVRPSSNSDINEVTQVGSEFHPSSRGDLHGERHTSSMVQESLNGDILEVQQVNTIVQPSSNSVDILEVQPSLNGDLHEETQASSMVQPSLNGDLHEASSMVQPTSSGDIHNETIVSEMVQPSPNVDIPEVQSPFNVGLHGETQVSSMVQPSPSADIHVETHSSEKVQPSLNGDLHEEETHASSMVQPTPNGDIHKETTVSEMVQPSLHGDLPKDETHASSTVHLSASSDCHEVTQVSTMIKPSATGDTQEAAQVSSVMHLSREGDLHEEPQVRSVTHASSMVQPTPNSDIHNETPVSEMVQPSLNGDLPKDEETHASSTVQPSTSGDCHEVTQVNTMVKPSPTGDTREEAQVRSIMHPLVEGDIHEATSMVQPSHSGDIHTETTVSEMVQPSLNGDVHEAETQASSTVLPTHNGDIHKEKPVSEMLQPSLNSDIHEAETHASSTVQPTHNGDIHTETTVSEMVQPSFNSDVHEAEAQASSMVQATPNVDIHKETPVSEMVQQSLNSDLPKDEETHASLTVQPSTSGDCHEATQVNKIVKPSPTGETQEETQVTSAMHPPPQDDLHEETQVTLAMHPPPQDDLHEETQVTSAMHPPPQDDLHEETQVTSAMHPPPQDDLHEETQVTSAMHSSHKSDPHEETHVD